MGGGSSFRMATFSSGLAGVVSSAPVVTDVDIGGGAGVPLATAFSSDADAVVEAVGFGGMFSLLEPSSLSATIVRVRLAFGVGSGVARDAALRLRVCMVCVLSSVGEESLSGEFKVCDRVRRLGDVLIAGEDARVCERRSWMEDKGNEPRSAS